jgi:hypothetical protein
VEPDPPAKGTMPARDPAGELPPADSMTRGRAAMAQEAAKTTKITVASPAAGRIHRCPEIGSAPVPNRRTTARQKARPVRPASSRLRGADRRRAAGSARSAMIMPGGTACPARIFVRIRSSPSALGTTESASV